MNNNVERKMTGKEIKFIAFHTVAVAINQRCLKSFRYKLEVEDTRSHDGHPSNIIMNITRMSEIDHEPVNVVTNLKIIMPRLIKDIDADWDNIHNRLDTDNNLAMAMVDSTMTVDRLEATVLNFYGTEIIEYGNLIKQMLTLMESEYGPNSN